MAPAGPAGQIVILNGTPRAGKSSIAAAIQRDFEGVWMNLGVDRFKAMTPDRYQPGIGLRPGAERPDLEPLIALLYRAMYESIAAHSRLGLNAVVDVGHHDGSVPAPVRLWQQAVHEPGIYDLEVDTAALGPDACAEAIRQRLRQGPPGSAFQRLADMAEP